MFDGLYSARSRDFKFHSVSLLSVLSAAQHSFPYRAIMDTCWVFHRAVILNTERILQLVYADILSDIQT